MTDMMINQDQPATQTKTKKQTAVRVLARGVITIIAAVVVAVYSVTVIVPLLMGATTATVVSGSMAPDLRRGDTTVMQEADPDALHVGDVITYMPADDYTHGIVIIHRVQKILRQDDKVVLIITKGDANEFSDDPITPEQVRSKMIYSVPYAGYPKLFMSQFVGWTE